MEKKVWEKRDMDSAEINAKIEKLEDQILAFELRLRYEEKQILFREIYMDRYEERITLGDTLELMMENGLCSRISVFNRD